MGIFSKKKATLFATTGGIASLFGISHGRSGGPTTVEGALEVNAVFSAARVIAEGIAQMPIRLIEETEAGRQTRTRVAKEHWAHRLLSRKPNPWQTPHEFIEGMGFSAALGRAALAIKVKVGNEVRELLPVPPSAWDIEQSSDYGVRYRITFYDGSVQYFSQEDVFTFRGVSLDGITAIPAIQKARRAIGLTQSLEEQQANLAENGGRPSGILSFKSEITPETKSKLRETWQRLFGPGGPGGIAVLDQDATYSPISLSLADSQFIENRRFQIEEIARAFRVQPIMLMQADKAATFASAEQNFKMHVVHTLMPWVNRIEQALNRDILNNDSRFRFDIDNIEMLRGDQAAQSDYFTKALGAGGQPAWLSVNEVRAECGLNPIDEDWAKVPMMGAMNKKEES